MSKVLQVHSFYIMKCNHESLQSVNIPFLVNTFTIQLHKKRYFLAAYRIYILLALIFLIFSRAVLVDNYNNQQNFYSNSSRAGRQVDLEKENLEDKVIPVLVYGT